MASRVDICNIALSRIGVSQFIANIETERSNEANVCRLFFDPMRDFALRDYPWSFAKREIALAQLDGDAPVHWAYKYALPSDCLMVRSVVTAGALRVPRHDQRTTFEIANEAGPQGDIRVLYTGQPNAVLIYTKRIEDPTLFDPIFVSAFAYLLASEIALPLTVKETIAKQCRDAYVLISSRAAAVNMNEAEEGVDPEPEAIEYRNG